MFARYCMSNLLAISFQFSDNFSTIFVTSKSLGPSCINYSICESCIPCVHIFQCCELFELLGVPWVQAEGEAEATCAALLYNKVATHMSKGIRNDVGTSYDAWTEKLNL